MSLILDALRKSEAERRRGDAPDLFAPMPVASPRHRRAVPVSSVWVVSVLLVLAATAWWRSRPESAAPGAPTRINAPDASRRPTLPSPPVEPPQDARLAPTPVAPRTAGPKPSPLHPEAVNSGPDRNAGSAPAANAAPPTPAPAGPAPSPPPPVAPATTDPTASDGAVLPRLGDLDAARRASLPPLRLSMHVWDGNPDHRFAIIDGQRVIEGSALGDTLVREIRRDGVVLSIDGRDYLLPR